jgi:hypothetical protein
MIVRQKVVRRGDLNPHELAPARGQRSGGLGTEIRSLTGPEGTPVRFRSTFRAAQWAPRAPGEMMLHELKVHRTSTAL